jgi:hypothetical protein
MKISPEQWLILCTYLRLIVKLQPHEAPVWISDYTAQRLERLIDEIEKENYRER